MNIVSKPMISVGMPVYNGAKFLKDAIESIRSQTCADFELIISDNASTDDTEAICRQQAKEDRRIRYERLNENQGAVTNFNRLIGMASGKYFKWAAADDICMPTYLESMLMALESDPQAAWAHSQFGKISHDGTVLTADNPIAEGLAHSAEAGFPRDGFDSPKRHRRFQGVLLGTAWCADIFGLIRKNILDCTVPMSASFGCEKVLIGELALRGTYREVPETLFFQRTHADAAGHRASREEQDQVIAAVKSKGARSSRWSLLRGHLKSIQNVPMTRGERARCFAVVFQYLTQVSKWRHIIHSEWNRLPLKAAPRS